MRIRRTEVKTYKVDAICDGCGMPLVPTGKVNDINPFSPKGTQLQMKPTYEHVCSGCHNRVRLNRQYPYTEYKEV